MVIAGFMDFTCPYCRRLVPVLDSVLAVFPEQVAFEFHYFPLAGHEFGMVSAVAAECAAQQGRFLDMYRTLYSEMASLGVVPWRRLGERAGVANLELFDKCLELPAETFKRIMAGRTLGEEIGVFGTPTVWVNGEHFLGRTVSAFTEKAREAGIAR